MILRIFLLINLLMIQCFSLYSQGSLKHYQTKRIEIPPHIDGLLDDESWAHVPGQSDFMQTRPIEGAVPTMRTEFKIVYDDFAIYVGAMMYDSHPDSILHELSLRDGFDPSSPQNYISINADLFRLAN